MSGRAVIAEVISPLVCLNDSSTPEMIPAPVSPPEMVCNAETAPPATTPPGPAIESNPEMFLVPADAMDSNMPAVSAATANLISLALARNSAAMSSRAD